MRRKQADPHRLVVDEGARATVAAEQPPEQQNPPSAPEALFVEDGCAGWPAGSEAGR